MEGCRTPLLLYHNIFMHFRLGRYCSPDVTLGFSHIAIVYLKKYGLFALQGQDSLVHNSSGRNYMPMLYVPYRYRALRVRSFALPVALKEIPLVKSASLVLNR